MFFSFFSILGILTMLHNKNKSGKKPKICGQVYNAPDIVGGQLLGAKGEPAPSPLPTSWR